MEGGGAKGSYHVGAIKALYENGYKFDGVTGTSIGAINAAMVAQGDIDLCYHLWSNALTSKIMDIDDEEVENLLKMRIKFSTVKYFYKLIGKALKERGISTKRIEQLMHTYIDEDKIRNSNMDFGLVTVSLTDRFQPVEVFAEEIPAGMMHDYILASAFYPAFQGRLINGKRYIDGGLYDNLPINPLIRRGYKEIVAIRTKRSNLTIKKPMDSTVKVHYIQPSEPLGGTLVFSNERIMKNIKMGYYDALRFIHNYSGRYYYIRSLDNSLFTQKALSLPEGLYKETAAAMSWNYTSKRDTLDKILEHLNRKVKRRNGELNYAQKLLVILEEVARQYKIERFKVYSLTEFALAIKKEFEKDGGSGINAGKQLNAGLMKSGLPELLKIFFKYIEDNENERVS